MRKAYLALLALLAAAAPAAAQGGWAEKMFKGKLTHDFGTVPRGAQLVHHFPVTNIYAVRMEITSIKSGCGCVTATAAKRVLGPRESTTVEVRLDAARFSGAKTVGVRVTVGPEFISSAELKLTATSRADIVFNPGQVSFGTVARGSTPSQTVDVEYAGAMAWKVEGVVAKDVPFAVAVKEAYRRPGQVGYQLQVTLNADAPPGPLRHEVFLKTNDPASPLVPVLVEGTVQSAVTVSPSTLALGTVKVGEALVRRVVVRGSTPFRVLGVDGTGDGVELSGTPPATPAAVQTVTFKCQFAKPGDFKRTLKIKTTLQDDPVVVTLEGSAAK